MIKKRKRIILQISKKKMFIITDSYIKNNIGMEDKLVTNYISNCGQYSFFLDKLKSLFSEELIPHYWSLYTDGEWLWSADLNYYVQNFGLKLPNEFVVYIKKNKLRKLSDDDYFEIDSFFRRNRILS